jgi:hypothetical protein
MDMVLGFIHSGHDRRSDTCIPLASKTLHIAYYAYTQDYTDSDMTPMKSSKGRNVHTVMQPAEQI